MTVDERRFIPEDHFQFVDLLLFNNIQVQFLTTLKFQLVLSILTIVALNDLCEPLNNGGEEDEVFSYCKELVGDQADQEGRHYCPHVEDVFDLVH